MIEERVQRVLWAVVDSYILNPDPVGSRFVTKKYAFNLSSATIRNIMADLEEMGFLSQPHTSAGRIPTDKGYRFYVDSLAQKETLMDSPLAHDLTKKLENIRKDITSLLKETTKTLSMFSHYLGVALSPNPEKTTVRRIGLFRYRTDRLAITLLTDEGIIQSKILHFDPEITQQDLSRISAYLNAEFTGYTIDEIRSKVLQELQREKILCDTLISKAIKICREAMRFGQSDVFISGLTEVLGLPDFSDLERIKEVSRAIEDKHLIIKLLDALSESEGVKVIIGSENSATEMKRLSMVVSTYREGDRPIGTLGVIGPTRMDYLKAITIVDTTARLLTKILTEGLTEG
ncbi:MAG TPA: heat-inducible transcription repressor HrcA [Nitrospiraceae bacterium]|jgi:heat-inducible transcriptional repressor|nr:heat-inducible transcription repressor HrcA [Nitrospiraceae bacterium]